MIRIVAPGKIKEKYLMDLVSDYLKRIQKYHKIEIIELKDNEDIKKETVDILKCLNEKDYNIALTITGKNYDSLSFAKHIDDLFNHHSTITFFIGGSNGLDSEVISLCDEEISFGAFTFPHGLFRGILLEQIYRAFKINNNERYHK